MLDQAHRKRNIAEYEGAIDVDENLVGALIRVTEEVAVRVPEIRAGAVPRAVQESPPSCPSFVSSRARVSSSMRLAM